MTTHYQDEAVTLLCGDALAMLQTLPSESVQTVVTSPPYYGLRNYNVDGQIGLEATPDAYVAALVAIFREVRRVLHPTGTVWCNLGDTFASSTKGSGGQGKSGLRRGSYRSEESRLRAADLSIEHQKFEPRRFNMEGIKPKDLIGIPWRVAFALQQPYYTGRITREIDRVWLAAMIDAEGCMFVHKRKIGQNNGQGYERKSDSYAAGMEVANTHEAVVQRCLEITGVGSICRQDKDRRQPLYRWNLRSNECRDIVREVYPYLVAKKHQARLLIGCPSSGPLAEAAHAAMILLHGGSQTTVDFPDPKSMFEPGFYLRSDVIWAKSNPMPESVEDRPTKSHEYIFLLTKSADYFYDADAIAERSTHAGKTVTLGAKSLSRGQAAGANVAPSGNGTATSVAVTETRNKRSVWTIATTPYPGAHFAVMPEALVTPCILAGSRPGDVVLDPFVGSGTVAWVAKRLGRRAVGIELEERYCEAAARRLQQSVMALDCG